MAYGSRLLALEPTSRPSNNSLFRGNWEETLLSYETPDDKFRGVEVLSGMIADFLSDLLFKLFLDKSFLQISSKR